MVKSLRLWNVLVQYNIADLDYSMYNEAIVHDIAYLWPGIISI